MTDALLCDLRSMGRTHDDATVAHEAADEIERLRGANADLLDALRDLLAYAAPFTADSVRRARNAIAKAGGE